MFTFFFTEESPFSQWFPCAFVVGGKRFNCAEQFMMHGKAQLFGDVEVDAAIVAAAHPREHKALGRTVRGFEAVVWERERERIVKDGNRAKFTQNAELLQLLLDTRGTTLVEASPFDRIWGIGLEASDPRAQDPAQWRGMKLWRKVLTELREELAARA